MMSEECRNSFMTEVPIILSLQSLKLFVLLQLINVGTTSNYKLLLWRGDEGGNFSRGQLSRHQKLHNILCYVHY